MLSATPPTIGRPHIRDLADGIYQLMFFWGQDVTRPEGNFLVSQGFERSPSTGIKGTSCYLLPWRGGHIELYGSCAGWYGPAGGFAFIRPRRRCAIWTSPGETPIPGAWQPEHIETGVSPEQLQQAAEPFLDWVLAYEETVCARFGTSWREENYDKYRKLPKSKAWLPPTAALQWLETFHHHPDELVRARQLAG